MKASHVHEKVWKGFQDKNTKQRMIVQRKEKLCQDFSFYFTFAN